VWKPLDIEITFSIGRLKWRLLNSKNNSKSIWKLWHVGQVNKLMKELPTKIDAVYANRQLMSIDALGVMKQYQKKNVMKITESATPVRRIKMEKSQTISELAKALIAFQSEIGPISFDADNPFYKSKYATLAQLVKEAAPIVSKHGLAVSQLCEGDGGVTTILIHSSGEYLSSTLTLRAVKDDPQGHGSAITYTRRYAYASILGLVSEEDDDGNSASHVSSGHKSGANGEKKSDSPLIPPTLTLRGMIDKLAIEKLGSLDKFQIWRTENNLPENLDGLKDFDLAKVLSAIREYKSTPMKRV
jgi:hypothetical protein